MKCNCSGPAEDLPLGSWSRLRDWFWGSLEPEVSGQPWAAPALGLAVQLWRLPETRAETQRVFGKPTPPALRRRPYLVPALHGIAWWWPTRVWNARPLLRASTGLTGHQLHFPSPPPSLSLLLDTAARLVTPLPTCTASSLGHGIICCGCHLILLWQGVCSVVLGLALARASWGRHWAREWLCAPSQQCPICAQNGRSCQAAATRVPS